MTSSFNFIPTTLTEVTATAEVGDLPIYKELAYDFATGQLKTIGGKYYYVEKNEALKIWIYKSLLTSRFTYLAHSADYGNEIHTLIGWYLTGEVLESELRRMIEEALLVNPYLLAITDFKTTHKGSNVYCQFGVDTVYGKISDLDYTYLS